jgi:hypothetical protein
MRTRKRRQVGTAGLVIRYRNGTCAHECRACGYWETFARWRPALRSAKAHAADHAAGDIRRYMATSEGSRALGPRRPRWRRRLAGAVVILILAAIAFTVTVAAVTSRAAPAAVPSLPAAAPATTGYSPTVAGPPATDASGQWIPEPDPPTSTSAGGGRR